MPVRRDGPKHGIPASVRNNVPRIWCNHCDGRNLNVGDARRHYRDSHPQHLNEQPFWCAEIYVNSRHGTNSAAQLARTRVQQVIAFLNGGPPVTAAPIHPAAPDVDVYAVLACSLPSRSTDISTQLTGTIFAQTALPLAGAAAINVDPPALPVVNVAATVLANAPAQLPAQANVPAGFTSASTLRPASTNGAFPFGYPPGFGTGNSSTRNTARPSFGQVRLPGQHSTLASDDKSDGEAAKNKKEDGDDGHNGHSEKIDLGTDNGRLSKLEAFFPTLYEGGTITNNHEINWTLEYNNCIVMSNRAAARAANCRGQATRVGMTKVDEKFHRGMARTISESADAGRSGLRRSNSRSRMREDDKDDAMDVSEEYMEES